MDRCVPFSAQVGGAVDNAAINRYAYATTRLHGDRRVRIHSADNDPALDVPGFVHLAYVPDPHLTCSEFGMQERRKEGEYV
jgi:hypothetical protein